MRAGLVSAVCGWYLADSGPSRPYTCI